MVYRSGSAAEVFETQLAQFARPEMRSVRADFEVGAGAGGALAAAALRSAMTANRVLARQIGWGCVPAGQVSPIPELRTLLGLAPGAKPSSVRSSGMGLTCPAGTQPHPICRARTRLAVIAERSAAAARAPPAPAPTSKSALTERISGRANCASCVSNTSAADPERYTISSSVGAGSAPRRPTACPAWHRRHGDLHFRSGSGQYSCPQTPQETGQPD